MKFLNHNLAAYTSKFIDILNLKLIKEINAYPIVYGLERTRHKVV